MPFFMETLFPHLFYGGIAPKLLFCGGAAPAAPCAPSFVSVGLICSNTEFYEQRELGSQKAPLFGKEEQPSSK